MRSARSIWAALVGFVAHPIAGVAEHPPSLPRRDNIPPPPLPEPIEVVQLPLPPVTPNDWPGGCTLDINPRGTGCIAIDSNLQNGNFLPDGNHILAIVNFTGAPAIPSPASVYDGMNLILVRTNGTNFPNGDPWKCVTCGVPEGNMVGSWSANDDTYPQAFLDGKRVLIGYNIADCSPYDLVSEECTPNTTFLYPIRWNTAADGSGPSGSFREVRIHPDNVHIGFNSFSFSGSSLGEFAYFARLSFNPSPTTGSPLSPRYDLVNITMLYDSSSRQLTADGNQLIFNPEALAFGEFRGFTGRGDEVIYLGSNVESCNFDVFAANMTTGKVRRITRDPGYTDPIAVSADNKWQIILTTYGTGRMAFLAGMRGVPPITDVITEGSTASVRNNQNRRFFQPWLLDYYGGRGDYIGQQINAAGDGSTGSINDPNWNAGADPRWSHDGTRVVYFQALVVPPECGGTNPLPCPNSTAPGGGTYRLMLAIFTGRTPDNPPEIAPVPDVVPWGIPYVPGSAPPLSPPLVEGDYTLGGIVCGHAQTSFTLDSTGSYIKNVVATYHNYSDDGLHFISGTENVTATPISLTLTHLDWYSDLSSTGVAVSTKVTSPDGFHLEIDELNPIFNANGTLTTTVDGRVYKQPVNGG